jgi:hypothetical protein
VLACAWANGRWRIGILTTTTPVSGLPTPHVLTVNLLSRQVQLSDGASSTLLADGDSAVQPPPGETARGAGDRTGAIAIDVLQVNLAAGPSDVNEVRGTFRWTCPGPPGRSVRRAPVTAGGRGRPARQQPRDSGCGRTPQAGSSVMRSDASGQPAQAEAARGHPSLAAVPGLAAVRVATRYPVPCVAAGNGRVPAARARGREPPGGQQRVRDAAFLLRLFRGQGEVIGVERTGDFDGRARRARVRRRAVEAGEREVRIRQDSHVRNPVQA